MDDRQLLEAAAKAAGLQAVFENDKVLGRIFVNSRTWNPLTDDGDALRLAVKLSLMVTHFPFQAVHVQWDCGACMKDYGTDPCAATRRAIVIAAASIEAREAGKDSA